MEALVIQYSHMFFLFFTDRSQYTLRCMGWCGIQPVRTGWYPVLCCVLTCALAGALACKPGHTEVHGVVRGPTGPGDWIPVLCCVLMCALAGALLWVGGSVEG
jgi:hypothetical protein